MYIKNYRVFTHAATHTLCAGSYHAALLTALEIFPTDRIYRIVEDNDWEDDHEE